MSLDLAIIEHNKFIEEQKYKFFYSNASDIFVLLKAFNKKGYINLYLLRFKFEGLTKGEISNIYNFNIENLNNPNLKFKDFIFDKLNSLTQEKLKNNNKIKTKIFNYFLNPITIKLSTNILELNKKNINSNKEIKTINYLNDNNRSKLIKRLNILPDNLQYLDITKSNKIYEETLKIFRSIYMDNKTKDIDYIIARYHDFLNKKKKNHY